jgi:subtilisin-like proprotein convertase family protein
LYNYRPVSLDLATLRPVLAAAPMEGTPAAARGTAASVVSLPLPDGSTGRFRLVEAPVMAPELAAQFPMIKTYAGVGIDDPTASVRCDLTPLGFHAQILSRAMGTIYIDPISIADPTHYVSFFRHDMNRAARGGRDACGFVPPAEDPAQRDSQRNHAAVDHDQAANNPTAQRVQVATGGSLRTYRFALAATFEYVRARGGTAVSALASMTTSTNRVVGVYEKELAVRLILVPNTNLLIASSALTYSNNQGGTMLGQNQTRVDQIIGNANYDIGHVFSTGGGGIAGLGVVCTNGQKARGVTGSPSPTGDAFDIDYVAHEVGHQFGGNHPFNGSSGSCSGGNRNPGTSWEPGSGSTIMGYAGICGAPDDLQPNSDAYFHSGNYQEMQAEINTTSCFVTAATGNTPPTVSVGPTSGRTIPKSTPFRLIATGADADGDALTYNWENMDTGGANGRAPSTATNQVANQRDPLFRSFNATASPIRYFPQLSKIISGTTPVVGEALPTVTRSLKFRCTVRDEHVSTPLGFVVGGVNYSSTITMNVDAASGPFVLQTPNGPGGPQWNVGSPATVTWDVANTNVAPVSCSNVDLILSKDGGLTYTDTLAANVPNTGTATFLVPATIAPTTQARVMVHARDNYFFDISNANFSIQPPLSPDYALLVSPASRTVCPGVGASFTIDVASLAGYTTPVDLTLSAVPAGVTATYSQTTVTPGSAAVTLNVTTTATAVPGTYPLTITATAAGANVKTSNISLTVSPAVTAAAALLTPADAAASQPLAPTFTWAAAPSATFYTFELSDNAAFTGTLLASVPNLANPTYTLTGVALSPNTTYYWRIGAANGCGAGPTSTGFSFTTLDVSCSSDACPNLPVAISNNTVNATLVSTACGTVQDVNVKNIQITYPNTGDLDIFLVSPAGRVTLLAQGLCPGRANYNLNFDDQAAVSYNAIPCPTAAGGTYRPLAGLSRYNGEQASGNWTLRVVDNTGQRNGSVVSWSLEVCAAPAPPVAPINLAAPTAVVNNVVLTWTDKACNETQQLIERSVGGGANYAPLTTVGPNITTYTDATAAANTTYCYRVRAESATQQSAFSPELCITTRLLGVSGDGLASQLTVAPNPSAGEFAVRLTDAPAGTTRLVVLDAVGRIVQSAAITSGAGAVLNHALDLRTQAEGVYTLRLLLPDGRTGVRRLVKL